MRKIATLFGIIILCFFSCRKANVRDAIIGVWFSEHDINTFYSSGVYEDSSLFFHQSFPVIYDFYANGDMLMKSFRGNDTIFKWSLKSDSILTINNLDFHIEYISHDSVIFIYSDKYNYHEFDYGRPKETKIKKSKGEIENIMLSNIWSTDDPENEVRTHFEFLDNQTMVYRYRFDATFDTISQDNLQMETWGIAKYKDYAFLYNYYDSKFGNGYNDSFNQIVDIDTASFTLLFSYPKKEEYKYLSKKTPDNKEAIRNIQGNWTSINTGEKSYGRFSTNQLNRGDLALYEGKLNLSVTTDSLAFMIPKLIPMTFNWQLSKDARILVLEYMIDEPERKGIHVEYADILELTDKKLKIRFFFNRYFTGLNKPQEYLLNLIQEFERVD